MDDGGPAFPQQDLTQFSAAPSYEGMSLRDWFAAHCPHEEVEKRMPTTVGDVADKCVALGWIKPYPNQEAYKAYTTRHRDQLRCWYRYEYADDMLKARK